MKLRFLTIPILSAHACTRVANIIAFGDSLTATSQTRIITNQLWPLHQFYPSGRFSDDGVYVDYLSHHLRAHVINWAVGSATTDSDVIQGATRNGKVAVPGVKSQVLTFNHANVTGHQNVFILFAGANDFFFGPKSGRAGIEAAVRQGRNVEMVIQKGATTIVVPMMPDLKVMPYFQKSSLPVTQFSMAYNRQLALSLNLVRQQYPTVTIVSPDFYQTFNNIVEMPLEYGIDEVTKPCIDPSYTTTCDDPSTYAFYDEFHPGSRTHQILANTVLDTLRDLDFCTF